MHVIHRHTAGVRTETGREKCEAPIREYDQEMQGTEASTGRHASDNQEDSKNSMLLRKPSEKAEQVEFVWGTHPENSVIWGVALMRITRRSGRFGRRSRRRISAKSLLRSRSWTSSTTTCVTPRSASLSDNALSRTPAGRPGHNSIRCQNTPNCMAELSRHLFAVHHIKKGHPYPSRKNMLTRHHAIHCGQGKQAKHATKRHNRCHQKGHRCSA